MTAANATFGGADNGVDSTTAQQRALYLKLYAGEVISSFEKHTVTLDKHTVRTITAGKSAQVPVIGRIPDAEYHTPGAEILGQDVPHSERVIPVDKLLISHIFIDDLDEAMRHFEVRGKYADMQGQKLAQTFDRNVMLNITLAAQASANITGEDGGLVITNANLTNADDDLFMAAWLAVFRSAKTNFDNKFVAGVRYAAVKPETYNRLATLVQSNGFSLVNRDHGVTQGDLSMATLPPIAGIQVISSAMLPTTDLSGQEFHAVDMRNTEALIFTEDAVGTVKLMDISLQSQWDIRRQGTLMVARYAMGHAYLRPESAIHVRTAAPA